MTPHTCPTCGAEFASRFKFLTHICRSDQTYADWEDRVRQRLADYRAEQPAELLEAAAMHLPPLTDGGALALKQRLARLTGDELKRAC